MEQKPLPIGVDDFEKLIASDYYYVDKTMFIKELIDKKGDVNLFTRPRRFGKSLNMSMLRYYFEDGRNMDGEKEDYSRLFDGLNIARCAGGYRERMGKYPVIALTLKSAGKLTFSSSYKMLVRRIASEFERHKFILSSPAMAGKKSGIYL